MKDFIVVCNLNHTLVHKCYIHRVSLSQVYIPSKCFYAVFQYCASRHDLGLSNESLFIIIGQGAAKLWPFKVGSQKKDSIPDQLEPRFTK